MSLGDRAAGLFGIDTCGFEQASAFLSVTPLVPAAVW